MHAFMLEIVAWLTDHLPILAALVLVGAFLLWKQPRQTLKLLVAIGVIVVLGYLVSGIANFTMKSATTKEHMIEKPIEQE